MLIRSMYAKERPVVAQVIGEAMMTDPGWAVIEGDERYRRELLINLVDQTIRISLASGGDVLVAEVDGEVGGALVWDPPGEATVAFSDYVGGVAQSLGFVGRRPRTAVRTLRNLAALDQMKPAHGMFYVAFLGCRVQGRGVGSALVRAAAKITPDSPMYLETQNMANVDFYERLGFVCVDHRAATYRGGPSAQSMVRPAESSASGDVVDVRDAVTVATPSR